MKQFVLLLLCVVFFFGCKEEEVDPRKKYKYNVFLRMHDSNRAFYAGSTVGLGSCSIVGRRSLAERSSHELAGGGWEIVCCWRTKGSQCKEEHNYKDKDVPYEEWKRNKKYHHAPKRQYFFKKH